MTIHDLGPLVKTANVALAPIDAFELFTARMGAWWPLTTHSVGLENATDVVVEPGVGADIVETLADGSTSIWGTVDVWEPPHRLRFTWHPGTSPGEATLVEVRFRETETGTAVELVHTGWEHRPDGAAARTQYDPGWDFVFGLFAAAGNDGSAVADSAAPSR